MNQQHKQLKDAPNGKLQQPNSQEAYKNNYVKDVNKLMSEFSSLKNQFKQYKEKCDQKLRLVINGNYKMNVPQEHYASLQPQTAVWDELWRKIYFLERGITPYSTEKKINNAINELLDKNARLGQQIVYIRNRIAQLTKGDHIQVDYQSVDQFYPDYAKIEAQMLKARKYDRLMEDFQKVNCSKSFAELSENVKKVEYPSEVLTLVREVETWQQLLAQKPCMGLIDKFSTQMSKDSLQLGKLKSIIESAEESNLKICMNKIYKSVSTLVRAQNVNHQSYHLKTAVKYLSTNNFEAVERVMKDSPVQKELEQLLKTHKQLTAYRECLKKLVSNQDCSKYKEAIANEYFKSNIEKFVRVKSQTKQVLRNLLHRRELSEQELKETITSLQKDDYTIASLLFKLHGRRHIEDKCTDMVITALRQFGYTVSKSTLCEQQAFNLLFKELQWLCKPPCRISYKDYQTKVPVIIRHMTSLRPQLNKHIMRNVVPPFQDSSSKRALQQSVREFLKKLDELYQQTETLKKKLCQISGQPFTHLTLSVPQLIEDCLKIIQSNTLKLEAEQHSTTVLIDQNTEPLKKLLGEIFTILQIKDPSKLRQHQNLEQTKKVALEGIQGLKTMGIQLANKNMELAQQNYKCKTENEQLISQLSIIEQQLKEVQVQPPLQLSGKGQEGIVLEKVKFLKNFYENHHLRNQQTKQKEQRKSEAQENKKQLTRKTEELNRSEQQVQRLNLTLNASHLKHASEVKGYQQKLGNLEKESNQNSVQIMELKTSLDKISQYKQQLQSENTTLESEKAALAIKVEQLEIANNELSNQRDDQTKQINDLLIIEQKITNERNDLTIQTQRLQNEKNDFIGKLSDVEGIKVNLEIANNELSNQRDDQTKQINGLLIIEQKLTNERDDLMVQTQRLQKDNLELIGKLQDAEGIKVNLEQSINEANQKIQKVSAQLILLKKQNTQLQGIRKTEKKQNEELIQKTKMAITRLEKEKTALQDKIKQMQASDQELIKKMNVLNNKCTSYESQNQNLRQQNEKIKSQLARNSEQLTKITQKNDQTQLQLQKQKQSCSVISDQIQTLQTEMRYRRCLSDSHILDINPRQVQQTMLMMAEVQKVKEKSIFETTLCYRYDPNPKALAICQKKILNKSDTLIVIQTSDNSVVSVYCECPLSRQRSHKSGKCILFWNQTREVFNPIQNKQNLGPGTTYHEFYLILGGESLRLDLQKSVLYSKLGQDNVYFNYAGKTKEQFFEGKAQIGIKSFQIYTVHFEGQREKDPVQELTVPVTKSFDSMTKPGTPKVSPSVVSKSSIRQNPSTEKKQTLGRDLIMTCVDQSSAKERETQIHEPVAKIQELNNAISQLQDSLKNQAALSSTQIKTTRLFQFLWKRVSEKSTFSIKMANQQNARLQNMIQQLTANLNQSHQQNSTLQKVIEELKQKKTQEQTGKKQSMQNVANSDIQIAELRSEKDQLKQQKVQLVQQLKQRVDDLNRATQKIDDYRKETDNYRKQAKENTETIRIYEQKSQQMKTSNQNLQRTVDRLNQDCSKLQTHLHKMAQTNSNVEKFFQMDILYQASPQKEKLISMIEKHTMKTVRNTRFLHKWNPDSQDRLIQHVETHQNICVIVKTLNGYLLGAFSATSLQGKGESDVAFIFSLTNNIAFGPNKDKKLYKPTQKDNFFAIFGSSELRIRTGEPKVYSNFGIPQNFFEKKINGVTQSVDIMLGQGNKREVQIKGYEFYRIEFYE